MIALADGAAAVLRPPERILPSVWAERHIRLLPRETLLPGPWSHEVFPFLGPVMDACAEALETGRRGVVLMKAGQIGGSRAILNVLCYLKARYPGSVLYMTSTHDTAKEFSRDRFDEEAIRACEPLARKALFGRLEGELIQTKRFVDGKVVLVGGKSITAYESTPYPFVILDEYDSLEDELAGRGDPLANAEIRVDGFASMGARTLIIAFAHPSTRERGVGQLYYTRSDQRRAFVRCLHCDTGIYWLQWDHVRVEPREGESRARAERNAARYVYRSPCCDAIVSDSDRVAMARHTEQRSTLEPEVAAARSWIGVHVSQLYASNKPLEFLAETWIEGMEDDGKRRVWVNKRAGDVFAPRVVSTTPEEWRACVIAEGAPGAYKRGLVPDPVEVLTAGTDQRARQLHWVVWGWGHLRDQDGLLHLGAWLIDHGVVERVAEALTAADLTPFDELIYDRLFLRANGGPPMRVLQGAHDAGWEKIATYGYCLRRLQAGDPRARACKGASMTMTSASNAAPWASGAPPTWDVGGKVVRDPRPLLIVNTYAVKRELAARPAREITLSGGKKARLLAFPSDVGAELLTQLGSEYLTLTRGGEVQWVQRGPNHYLDASVYATAAALQLQPTMGGQTRDERAQRRAEGAEAAQRRRAECPPGVRPPQRHTMRSVRRIY